MSKQIDFVDLTGGMGTITATISTNFKLAALKGKVLDLINSFVKSGSNPNISEEEINNITLFDNMEKPLDTDEKLTDLLTTNEGSLVIKYKMHHADQAGDNLLYAGIGVSPGSPPPLETLGGSNPFGGRRRRYKCKTKRRNHKKRKSYRRK